MSIGIGETLREAREAQGRTQQDAAQSLRIRSDYVEALETEDFGVFGADTYARGHLRNYANLLGLDPQALLDIYDRYVRTDDQTAHHIADAPLSLSPRQPLPQWVMVIGGLVAVIGAIAVIGLLGDRAPDNAQTSIVDETSPTPTPSDPATSEPTSEPTTEPTSTPTIEGVEVLLVVEADCWMSISVDGQEHPRSNTTIPGGETLSLQASERIEITYGNAGGVIVEVNGESYGRAGGNGAVVDATYGPEGPVEDTPEA